MAYTTIKKPSDYFNTKLYTGDGNSSRSITGVGFATDMVWLKGRTTTYSHRLVDKLRTGTYPKLLYPNETSAESEDVNNFVSLDSDGFTIGVGNAVNQSGQTYVAWNWLANGSGSSNSDGSITSTVSANTTSGFSIVSYTGTGANATVGHGLGVAPKMIIIKNRIDAVNWEVGHDSIGWTKKLRLNTTDAETVDNGAFNDTAPTSSVFSLGNNGTSNGSGDDMIAYCFADVKGFSKFGSYTGNASLDGTFIYTGFKPSWVIIKRTDVINSWVMFDNKRNGTYGLSGNPRARHLYANTNDPEDSADNYNQVDFVSNGFKLREDNTTINASGGSYIYMAFAEEPLVGDNPATAR